MPGQAWGYRYQVGQLVEALRSVRTDPPLPRPPRVPTLPPQVPFYLAQWLYMAPTVTLPEASGPARPRDLFNAPGPILFPSWLPPGYDNPYEWRQPLDWRTAHGYYLGFMPAVPLAFRSEEAWGWGYPSAPHVKRRASVLVHVTRHVTGRMEVIPGG